METKQWGQIDLERALCARPVSLVPVYQPLVCLRFQTCIEATHRSGLKLPSPSFNTLVMMNFFFFGKKPSEQAELLKRL